MTLRRSFDAGKTVTLDGSGGGRVTLGPVPVGWIWEVERLAVEIAGGVTGNIGAEARVYRGAEVTSRLIDGTVRAGLDISELSTPLTLQPPDSLLFVFSGGTAGAVATAAASGHTRRQG